MLGSWKRGDPARGGVDYWPVSRNARLTLMNRKLSNALRQAEQKAWDPLSRCERYILPLLRQHRIRLVQVASPYTTLKCLGHRAWGILNDP